MSIAILDNKGKRYHCSARNHHSITGVSVRSEGRIGLLRYFSNLSIISC